jgi:arylsulfatase A-like enzyme
MRLGWPLMLVGVAAAAGCSWTRDARPHVVVVTIDTLRADHVSGYGYPRPTTPAIDRLLAEGATFLAASTPTPTTSPAHVSLFTASYPRTHGVLKNGMVLDPGRPTLAEALRARGYRTGAIVSAFPVAGRFGLARGFDHYDDTFDREHASIDVAEWEGMDLDEAFDRRADATTDRALAWLDSMRGGPSWFLWVHYYDVHGPYDPPRPYADLFRDPERSDRLGSAIAAYDGETRFVDDNVARLVERVDAAFGSRNVLLVIATDHGEGLMDHGWMAHGVHLYEELVRVVLAFRWPSGVAARTRSEVPVSLIDVSPTVLALLGLPSSLLGSEGHDLSPLLRGQTASGLRPIFFERRPYATRDRSRVPAVGPMRAVRDGTWKYVDASEQGVQELFDLSTDPGETRNLLASERATGERLATLLREWQATPHAGPSAPSVSEDDAARLRALGYVE